MLVARNPKVVRCLREIVRVDLPRQVVDRVGFHWRGNLEGLRWASLNFHYGHLVRSQVLLELQFRILRGWLEGHSKDRPIHFARNGALTLRRQVRYWQLVLRCAEVRRELFGFLVVDPGFARRILARACLSWIEAVGRCRFGFVCAGRRRVRGGVDVR